VIPGHRPDPPAPECDARTAAAVDRVVDLVRRIRVAGALNLYDETDSVAWGDEPGQASERTLALRGYLAAHWGAPTILVGEAPGQDGARWTGVPFTSCRQLFGSGPTEATATVVHRVLADLGSEDEVLLWNASMLFAPGNRDPRRVEVEACAPVLDLICRGRTVVAVGRFAQAATGAPYIRHPSHGGAARFADGLRVALGADDWAMAADRTLDP
jgi:uracil-DNA glycosylase